MALVLAFFLLLNNDIDWKPNLTFNTVSRNVISRLYTQFQWPNITFFQGIFSWFYKLNYEQNKKKKNRTRTKIRSCLTNVIQSSKLAAHCGKQRVLFSSRNPEPNTYLMVKFCARLLYMYNFEDINFAILYRSFW